MCFQALSRWPPGRSLGCMSSLASSLLFPVTSTPSLHCHQTQATCLEKNVPATAATPHRLGVEWLWFSRICTFLTFIPLPQKTISLQRNFQTYKLKVSDLWETIKSEIKRMIPLDLILQNKILSVTIVYAPNPEVNEPTCWHCDWIENRISGAGRNLFLMCISWFI